MLIIAIIGVFVTPICAMIMAAMLSSSDDDIHKLGFVAILLTVLLCLFTMDSIINVGIQMKTAKTEEIDWSQVQVNEYKENDKVVKITYTIDGKTFELPIKEN